MGRDCPASLREKKAQIQQTFCRVWSLPVPRGLSKPFFMGCPQARDNLWSDVDQTNWAGGHLPRVSSAPSLSN